MLWTVRMAMFPNGEYKNLRFEIFFCIWFSILIYWERDRDFSIYEGEHELWTLKLSHRFVIKKKKKKNLTQRTNKQSRWGIEKISPMKFYFFYLQAQNISPQNKIQKKK